MSSNAAGDLLHEKFFCEAQRIKESNSYSFSVSTAKEQSIKNLQVNYYFFLASN